VTTLAAPPVLVPPEIWALCKVSGPQYGITPELLAALAWKESGFDTYAWNPEPRYPYLMNVQTGLPFRKLSLAELVSNTPPADFPTLRGDPDNEWQAQRASWGLCQVMGAVAREIGFHGPYLTALVQPELNLDFGARHLAKQIARFGTAADGLSAYNAGRPVDSNRDAYVLPILRVADALLAQSTAGKEPT
jgi:Transglycosylase SLT domain